MRLRLLKLAAKRPLLAVLGALLGLGVLATALASVLFVRLPHVTNVDAQNPPSQVIGRIWFDSYPEKRTDDVQIWIWFGGGFGLHESGSTWRSSIEFFEFERQGDKLAMVYLQDKKKRNVGFKISACSEKPPFNLCLDLDEPLGKRKRYYGFAYDDDMDANIPWARSLRTSAEQRAVPR